MMPLSEIRFFFLLNESIRIKTDIKFVVYELKLTCLQILMTIGRFLKNDAAIRNQAYSFSLLKEVLGFDQHQN